MLLRIQHETRLTYSAPVSETVFEVRMAPPSDEDQTAQGYRLRIAPQAPVTSYRDGFGNRVDLFNVATPYQELIVQATSFVRTHRRPALQRLADVPWPGRGPVAIDAIEFLRTSPLVDRSEALDAFVAELSGASGPAVDVIGRLMGAVAGRIRYEREATSARSPVSEALALGRGVCQDFAHLFLGACRGLGVPARYVSGYLCHPGEVATHAWCQVWIGDRIGWVDVDPTHGGFIADEHVVTAVGRDYSDVPPNRGLWKGRAEESIAVTVKVEPIDRVPLEWNDWASPAAARPGTGMVQFQRLGPQAVQVQRMGRSTYPNQPRPLAGLHQQQGQQQQESARAAGPACQA